MLLSFAGHLLLGMGPAAVLFLALPARKPFLFILTFGSVGVWLLSLLLAALFVRAFLPLPAGSPWLVGLVVLAVLTQELTRVALWFAYKRGVKALGELARKLGCAELSMVDHMSMAFAIGMGHGLAHSLFFFLGVATLTLSPATYYIDTCPQMSLFLYLASTSSCFLLLHTFCSVVAWDGYTHRSALRIVLPPVAHLVAALLTVQSMTPGGCVAVLPGLVALDLAAAAYTGALVLDRAKHAYAN